VLIGAEVFVVRRRSRLSHYFVDRTAEEARQATGWRRYLYGFWGDDRFLSDPTWRDRLAFWVWVPAALFLPVFALVLLASAVAEFAR